MALSAEDFSDQIEESLRNFDKFIVCLDKAPQDCAESLKSLVIKAIKAYESRAPDLRHGIALDREVTVILSQTEGDKPLCGIYFNLSTPYRKQLEAAEKKEI